MRLLLQGGTAVLSREKREEKKESAHLQGVKGFEFSRVYTGCTLCNSGAISFYWTQPGGTSFERGGWLNGCSICIPGSIGTFSGVFSGNIVEEKMVGDPCMCRSNFWVSPPIDS